MVLQSVHEDGSTGSCDPDPTAADIFNKKKEMWNVRRRALRVHGRSIFQRYKISTIVWLDWIGLVSQMWIELEELSLFGGDDKGRVDV